MSRTTTDVRLDTGAARARLPKRKKPHYRLIDAGLHVGYYRGATGSSWIARRYLGTGSYETHRLGLTDDKRAADGVTVLTFSQAQARARAWATEQTRAQPGAVSEEPWTVAKAIEQYLIDYAARGGKGRRYVEITFAAHVSAKLAGRKIADLTPKIIRSWHRGLATAPARLRTSTTATKPKVRPLPSRDPEALRARRATANRIMTQLRAALNFAYRLGHAATDHPWRGVRPFSDVDAPVVRYLSGDEARRLINACGTDLRELVTAALLTGCRYRELASLQPADVDLAAAVLLVRSAKGGDPRPVVLTDEARDFLAQQTAGKPRTALIFEHNQPVRRATENDPAETSRMPWGRSHQFRPLREACTTASIMPPVSFQTLRHTYASRLAVKGVPMALIAKQLGHKDVKLTAKLYEHLSLGAVPETIRAAFGTFGLFPVGN